MKVPLPQLSDGGVEGIRNAVRVNIFRVTAEDFFVDPLGDGSPVNVAHGPVMFRMKNAKVCMW